MLVKDGIPLSHPTRLRLRAMRHKMLADVVKANPPDVSLVSPIPHVQPLNSFARLGDMADVNWFDHYVVRGSSVETSSPSPSPSVQLVRMT